MAYKSDSENSPRNSPELYRRAGLSDIGNPQVLGFYRHGGEYYRKNGSPQGDGRSSIVNILGPHLGVWTMTNWNISRYHVRLDEILSEENAPPEFFRLTRITVDVQTCVGLQKFGYLIGARGYTQEAIGRDNEEGTYEIDLEFLQPLLVPPTMLLNLIDDCGEAQGWEWEVDTKR